MKQMPIDHIGIAVANLEAATAHWTLLGLKLEGTERVEEFGVEVAFLRAGEARIELLYPIDPHCTIARFLQRRGQGIHHICFRVENLEAEMERLISAGFQLIDRKPRRGAHDTLVAFVHPQETGGVLVELAQTGPSPAPETPEE
jgi:methylmalonyl-CoA/ethylmalonyl-CoA epimerase